MSNQAQLERVNPMEAPVQKAETADVKAARPTEFSFSSDAVMLTNSSGPRAESIRALRTHIMAQHMYGGRRALAICSASEGVGATFIAVNLAMALAQIGVKVLLIDGDMRHPGVDAVVRPSTDVSGLRQCLSAEDASVGDYAQADVIENLSIMYSGGVAHDAQELLAGDQFGAVMERCMRDYDLTIIDTPPANSCADARRISTVAGYSLIVAKRHRSFVADITTLGEQLAQDRAKVVGAVMNEA